MGTLKSTRVFGACATVVAVSAATNNLVQADTPPDDRNHGIRENTPSVSNYYGGLANAGTQYAAAALVNQTDWQSGEIFVVSPTGVGYEVQTSVTYSATPANGGYAQCVALLPLGRCDAWNVVYQSMYWNSTKRVSTNFWRALACHEITHTVGVGERSTNDCLNGNYMAANYDTYNGRNPVGNYDVINVVYKNTV